MLIELPYGSMIDSHCFVFVHYYVAKRMMMMGDDDGDGNLVNWMMMILDNYCAQSYFLRLM